MDYQDMLNFLHKTPTKSAYKLNDSEARARERDERYSRFIIHQLNHI
jgi:hypothetical protein